MYCTSTDDFKSQNKKYSIAKGFCFCWFFFFLFLLFLSVQHIFFPCSSLLAFICSVSHSSARSQAQGRWDGILWFSKSKASPRVHIINAAGGPSEDAGAQGRVGVGRASVSVGGRAGRAGAADYSGYCQLQCLQSGSNRFRVGEEEVTVDFCQARLCLCLPAEWDDIREGDGGTVPPPHRLFNNSSACLVSLCCLLHNQGDYRHFNIRHQVENKQMLIKKINIKSNHRHVFIKTKIVQRV